LEQFIDENGIVQDSIIHYESGFVNMEENEAPDKTILKVTAVDKEEEKD